MITEIIDKIISTPKWYDNHYSQSHASKLIKSIRNGKMTIEKMIVFFSKFGYHLEIKIK